MLAPSLEGLDLLKTLSKGSHDHLNIVMFIWLHFNPELFDIWNNFSEDWISNFCLSFFTSVAFFLFFFWLLKFEMSKKIEVLDNGSTFGWFDKFIDLDVVNFFSWDLLLVIKHRSDVEERLHASRRTSGLVLIGVICLHDFFHVASFVQLLKSVDHLLD